MLFGEFYNGKRQSLYLDLAYRIQPYGIISLNASQDQVKFSNSINPLMIYLIGPKAEMAFTKKIFFTTFLQYNTQTKNMNVNTRFQWRFRPMCDLFFVYSDNYNETLMVKNRTIVLKFIYWLNIWF